MFGKDLGNISIDDQTFHHQILQRFMPPDMY